VKKHLPERAFAEVDPASGHMLVSKGSAVK